MNWETGIAVNTPMVPPYCVLLERELIRAQLVSTWTSSVPSAPEGIPMPAFIDPEPGLLDQYVAAFHKVVTHAHRLVGRDEEWNRRHRPASLTATS